MKNQITTALGFVFLSLSISAQNDMKVEWTKKYDHQTNWVGTGLEGENEVSYIATNKEITVYKTSDGSIAWSKAYKELVPGLRKVDAFAPFWESDALFLFDKKAGKDKLAVVDLNNGTVLWESTIYQGLSDENIHYVKEMDGFLLSLSNSLTFVDARTGEEKWSSTAFKGAIAMAQFHDGDIIMLNVAPPGLKGLFKGFKNQLARMNMSNGDIKWNASYVGIPEKKLVTKERIYDLYIEGEQVFLAMNGLQVYSVKTGASLWSASYGETLSQRSFVGGNSSALYGTVADPVKVGADIYIINRTKKKKFILNKYDVKSGKLLWASPEFKAAKAVPNLFVIEDKVIVQLGGVVEKQSVTKKRETDGSFSITYKVENKNIKPNGLMAFNTNDGSSAWDSEKFKKGITNAYASGNNLIVCSGKVLYSINYMSGNVNYEEAATNGGTGNVVQIMAYKDKVVVVGEKGVSLFNESNGKLLKANKYKKASVEKVVNNILLMRTAKNDFAAFNLDDCSYVMYNAKANSQQFLSEDGNYVWAYEKKEVTKLKTR